MTLRNPSLTLPSDFKAVWGDKAAVAWKLEQDWLAKDVEHNVRTKIKPAQSAAAQLCWLRGEFPKLGDAPFTNAAETVSFCLFLYASAILHRSSAFALTRDEDLNELAGSWRQRASEFAQLIDGNTPSGFVFELKQRPFFRCPKGMLETRIMIFTALRIVEQILDVDEPTLLDSSNRLNKKIFEYRERFGIEGECTIETFYSQVGVTGVVSFLQWLYSQLDVVNGHANLLIVSTLIATLQSADARIFSVDIMATAVKDLDTGRSEKCEPLVSSLLDLAAEKKKFPTDELLKRLNLSQSSLYAAGSRLNTFMKNAFEIPKVYKSGTFDGGIVIVRHLQ